MRDEAQLASILKTGENQRYLPGHKLSSNISCATISSEAISKSSLIFVTVPSRSFREVAREISSWVSDGASVVSGTKGVEIEGFQLMSQVLREEIPHARIGVLSGPNLAEEIAAFKLAGTVIASKDEELCAEAQRVLSTGSFRVYSNPDVYGVELGGALKNIYAIVGGMAAALELGQNAISMVVTRSLAEMSRFAVSMGASPYTFLGLAGVGDLVATCMSPHSRNYQLGYKVASGMTLEHAMEDLGKLAEGVNTLGAVCRQSEERDIYMPLARGLEQVLIEGMEIRSVIQNLMAAEHQLDVDFAAPVSWQADA